MRNYVLFALLPSLFCWWFSERRPAKSLLIFATVYLVGVLAFFIIPAAVPALNFPLFLANKQNEFLQLNGTSAITTTPLLPTFASYLSYLPTAFDMAFFRPHISEAKNLSYIPAAIEIMFLILVIVFSLVLRKKHSLTPMMLFFIFFSVSILLVSGYTVTFSGAIVRYRSFVLPLLITPLICMIDLDAMKNKMKALTSKR
jgi:hypothetical protein